MGVAATAPNLTGYGAGPWDDAAGLWDDGTWDSANLGGTVSAVAPAISSVASVTVTL